MNIRIKATNVTLGPDLTDYINKRLDKLAKFVSGDQTLVCDVEIGKTTGHHQKGDIFRAEIHVVGEGLDAYAAAEHEDIHMALGDAKEDIIRELRGRKGKKVSMLRRSGARVKAMVKGIMPWGEEGWYGKYF